MIYVIALLWTSAVASVSKVPTPRNLYRFPSVEGTQQYDKVQLPVFTSDNAVKTRYNDAGETIVGFSWTVNDAEDELVVELTYPSGMWMGFGVSATGSMKQMEAGIAHAERNEVEVVSSEYMAGPDKLFTVKNGENVKGYRVIGSSDDGISAKFSFARPLKGTAFENIVDIRRDQQIYFVWAVGKLPFAYHQTHRGAILVNAVHPRAYRKQEAPMPPGKEIEVTFTAPTVIPHNKMTNYVCQVVEVEFEAGQTAIRGIDYNIQNRRLHHMITWGCGDRTYEEVVDAHGGQTGTFDCLLWDNNDFCSELVLGWAPGYPKSLYPEDGVASPRLSANSKGKRRQTMLMEIHYENFDRKAGIVDQSGFKIILGTPGQESHLAFHLIGWAPAIGISYPAGEERVGHWIQHQYRCEEGFGPMGRTMFRRYPHMHLRGKQADFRIKRDGATIWQSEWGWDFEMQGIRDGDLLQFKEGDIMEILCQFDTNGLKEDVKGGWGSYQEMCMLQFDSYPEELKCSWDWKPLRFCKINKSEKEAWRAMMGRSDENTTWHEDLEQCMDGWPESTTDTLEDYHANETDLNMENEWHLKAKCNAVKRRKACNQHSDCRWNRVADTCEASISSVCNLYDKKPLCKFQRECDWDKSKGCFEIVKECTNFTKKQCGRTKGICVWDKLQKSCSAA